MDDALKHRILQRCIALKEDVAVVENKSHGICLAVKYYFGADEGREIQWLLTDIFVKWPEYSGNEGYPVPDPDWADDWDDDMHDAAARAFENADIETMWHGPYGEARMRLLDFIIQTLSEELHNAV